MEMQSPSVCELIKDLRIVQSTLKRIGYDSDNPFHKSKYASLNTVLEECHEVLHANKLCAVQQTITSEGGCELVTTLYHDSGEFIRSTLPLIMDKLTSQGQGSAMTYARRYSMLLACGVFQGKDDDGNAASGKEETKTETKPNLPIISSEQYKLLTSLLKGEDNLLDTVTKILKDKYKAKGLWECPASAYENLVKYIKDKKGVNNGTA